VDERGRKEEEHERLEGGEAAEGVRTVGVKGIVTDVARAQQPERTGDVAAIEVVPRIEGETLSQTEVVVRGFAHAHTRRVGYHA
jgi:hypothetical protein